MECKRCKSMAINHHLHGRDGSGKDLCDVCYWREKAEELESALNAAHCEIDAWVETSNY